MDLSEFLLARIAEDEHRLDLPDYDVVLNSKGQVSARGDGWVTRGDCPVCGKYMFDGTEVATEEAWWNHAEEAHQRSRLLAECDAKRRIVEQYRQALADESMPAEWNDGYISGQEYAVKLLALPHADHPDWRQEWKP